MSTKEEIAARANAVWSKADAERQMRDLLPYQTLDRMNGNIPLTVHQIEADGVVLGKVIMYDFLDATQLASIVKTVADRSGNDPYLIVKDHSDALPIVTGGTCNGCGTVQSNPQSKVCEACGLSFMVTLYVGY